MMKQNRRILSILAALLLTLAGCGSKSESANDSVSSAAAAMPTATAAPNFSGSAEGLVAEAAVEDSAAAAAPDVLENRKIIKHVNMNLETMEFDRALEQITALVEQMGGYIESMSADGQSLQSRGSYYERSASICARIPAERLEEAKTALGGLCNITSQSESMEDISDRYFDAQAHLDSLRLQEERLLEILSKAEKLEDVVTLEQALSEVRYEIESLTASLKRMDSQVAYSYLNLDLREVVEYNEVMSKPRTFGEQLSEAAARGWKNFASGIQGFILWMVESGPVLILLAAIAAAAALFARRSCKRRAAYKTAAKAPSAQEKVWWQADKPKKENEDGQTNG